MPEYSIDCQYCSHHWKEYFYSEANAAFAAKCPKCGDKNLKLEENGEHDIFGYKKDKK